MRLWHVVQMVLRNSTHQLPRQIGRFKNVRLIADIVTLDNGIQNSYAEHVLSGKSPPINYSTYVSIFQGVTFPSVIVSVARSASRLKTIFINFDYDS